MPAAAMTLISLFMMCGASYRWHVRVQWIKKAPQKRGKDLWEERDHSVGDSNSAALKHSGFPLHFSMLPAMIDLRAAA
jgi:hypothetical protein